MLAPESRCKTLYRFCILEPFPKKNFNIIDIHYNLRTFQNKKVIDIQLEVRYYKIRNVNKSLFVQVNPL